MSEEIDIESDNLCTTEDAFEKFQAVSMYEEDEFITLSDIVSPPPPSHDLTGILQIPAEDVNSLRVLEDTLNQISTTSDQHNQENTPESTLNQITLTSDEPRPENTVKKRGRKKCFDKSECLKVSNECSTVHENENCINNVTSQVTGLDSNSISKIEGSLPEISPDSAPLQKPPRSIKRKRNNRKGISKKTPKKQLVKTIGKRAKEKSISNSTHSLIDDKMEMIVDKVSVNEAILEKTQNKVTKRGRRKQNILSELIGSKVSLTEPKTISDFTSPSLSNKSTVKKRKKQKKSKKTISKDLAEQQKISEFSENQVLATNELTEDEIEDMPLVALSNKISQLDKTVTSDHELGTENESLNNDLTQTSQPTNNGDPAQKNRKRRGRPKKPDSNDSTQIKSIDGDIDTTFDNNIPMANTDDSVLHNSEIQDHTGQPEVNKNNSEANESNCEKTENVINDDANVTESQESAPETHNKRNSKKPIMSDFEYNIDSIVKNESQDDSVAQQSDDNGESETKDSTKRPVRRKVKKNLHYDEGSDEDPYANIELSDEEPRRRKGGKYYSDDEYIPGGKRHLADLSDSDIDDEGDEEEDELLGESTKQKRKSRKSDLGAINKSPKKRGRKSDIDKQCYLDVFTKKPSSKDGDGDFEDLLETSVIKTSEDAPKPWGTTKEFKDFLAKISQGTDIKIKKAKSIDNMKTPLQIPVLDPAEAKKTVEMCSQTNIIKTKPVAIQTNSVHEVPMKNQVALTTDQSEKACEFLSGIVKTTSELGQLMTQKSEDFIEKKINTTYVTDTFKMDYCVKKSFLLFRLAKHNLVQMEEDLAKQYEEFLKENNLIQHREEQTILASTSKAPNSDSDCEIVEEPVAKKKDIKAVFNPKTVFLNKELSIKIAKKSNEEPKPKENLHIKGRRTVWINDSIMVKKVKPVQSFLAQDSRNKKPPDTYVTLKMVSDFFKKYNHQKAISACAQYVSPEWLNVERNYTCYYFFDKNSDCSASSVANNEELITEMSFSENNLQNVNTTTSVTECEKLYPDTLLSLCTKVIQTQLFVDIHVIDKKCYFMEKSKIDSKILINKDQTQNITHSSDLTKTCILNKNQQSINIECLKTLCYKKVLELIVTPDSNEYNLKKISNYSRTNYDNFYEVAEDNYKINLECNSIIKEIEPLFSLCFKIIQDIQKTHNVAKLAIDKSIVYEPNSLKCIVFNKVKNIFYNKSDGHEKKEASKEPQSVAKLAVDKSILYEPNLLKCMVFNKVKNIFYNKSDGHEKIEAKEPQSVSFKPTISKHNSDINNQTLATPISLKLLCFNAVKKLYVVQYEHDMKANIGSHACIDVLNFTINNVNTVSEDVFLNTENHEFDETSHCSHEELEATYLHDDDEEQNFSDDCCSYDNNLEEENDGNNWVSQVQMKELRSFIESTNNDDGEDSHQVSDLHTNDVVNIKIEPLDEQSENVVASNVKTEPIDEDDTIFMPSVAITKEENVDVATSSKEPIDRQNSSSYDENAFEAFVSSNKLIMCMDSNYENINDEIFSQSSSRVRRQYEPDAYDDIENFADSLNLLVPQNVEIAKDRLMESSSDEDTNKKKKPEKRRGRPKRSAKINNAPLAKENLTSKSELAILTRKMKEKIRQIERQNESSESESEDTALSIRKEKEKIKEKSQKKQLCESKVPEKEIQCNDVVIESIRKEKEKIKEKSQKKQLCESKVPEKEIQCNDVDSTEQINENEPQSNETAQDCDTQIDIIQNAESENAIMDNVKDNDDKEHNGYNNEDSQLADIDDRSMSPLINENEPVELLECEPALPLLENLKKKPHSKKKMKTDVTAPVTENKLDSLPYIDRHGWSCYSIDTADAKIYQYAHIPLDKLPESFVETYFKYQGLSEQTEDDTEVDKLTNLQSLHRIQSKDKGPLKLKDNKNISTEPLKPKSSKEDTPLSTEVKVEPCDELSPSEDEESNVDDIPPPVAPLASSENCIAKDFLMNDESDSEKPEVDSKKSKSNEQLDSDTSPKKLGRASKHKGDDDKEKPKGENLMLTADKMMNKELALLHAPVDLKQELPDIKDVIKPATKNINKTVAKPHIPREKNKEDDSSSEEEKQWFTTKEKLLKRLEKKQECPNIDDAKRAKIVSEFIEKRNDGPKIRQRGRPSRRRSAKKLMERRKQMKILTRELLGDDSSHSGKKSYQTYGKGRRNIRKVINKKSLAHSTVMANMEEFERKQRLCMRQTQLREVLGCEEGVNVVVINDELCLEYDFEELRPVVTVHPFFTKVMKAHQYEGVKFMWDACFESVAQVRGARAGGGCILAHCMGLGKTLQVLALLHTVLTHPQVGMQRVLVCCPLSTVLNWVDEIHKWIGPVTGDIKVFELSKLKKTYERAYQLEDWYNGGGIFIIGYELFRSLTTLDPVLDCVRATIVNKIRTALLDPGPDIIICDEGHLLKNDCSVLAVAMSRVVTKRRIVLTGTPMQNNLREYYCMVNFVKPNLLGSYAEYSNRFENPIMNGQHRDSREEDIKLMKARTHILHKVLEGCLQRQEASVLYPYLPIKHEYTVFVSLTKSQRELYTHYLMSYAKETKQSVLKDFHVLQKIWTHPQVLHNFFSKTREDEKEQKIKGEKEDDLVQEDLGASEDIKPNATETWWLPYVADTDVLDALSSSNKFLVVFRLLEECIALGDKVLIFSTSLYTMDALEYFLKRINDWSLGREYYRLDGSVPAEVRQKWCREFNAESNTGTKLFLISTRAGSLGLNMTAANRVIILDTSWNPAHDIQSIFRVYRFGQKKDCYIYRLVAMGTMEQKIYERSVTKQAVACRVVDEQQIDRHYNMSELTELYRLDEDGSGVSAGLAAGVRDAALLRVAGCDAPSGPLLYAVHEHDSLLRGSGETGLPEDERDAVWSQFQEEHATKHIQNIAMNLPKKNNLSLITQNTDNSQQGTNNQLVPGVPEAKPKSKRGRKSSVANKNVPNQPSTSSQGDIYPLDPNTEEAMVKQIMNILIQHNFHITNNPKEISELVTNVRKTVAHRERGRFRNVDPVTASIAKVLIEEKSNSTPMPALTDINPDQSQTDFQAIETETIVGTPADYNSIYCANQIENQEYSSSVMSEYSGRKRRRPRKDADLVQNQEPTEFGETESTETIVGIPVDNSIYNVEQDETHESGDTEYSERKRRRQRRESDEEYVPGKQKLKNIAAPASKPTTRKSNEYSLTLNSTNTDKIITSEISPMVVTAETEEPQITQTANKKSYKKKEKEQINKTSKNKSASEKETTKPETETEKQRNEKEIGTNVEREKKNANESILLSDDDEAVESIPVQQVQNVNPQEDILINKEQVDVKQVDEAVIPLHKSLLTNDNFIKIVAHTYLSGNPMLDEDAAILAAQYSTLKALKEIESTGKHIVNGPIYDIAVQVLGKELLKKLHNASGNKKDTGNLQLGCAKVKNETTSSKTSNNTKKSASDPAVLPQNNSSQHETISTIPHSSIKIAAVDSEISPQISSEVKKKPGPKGKTMSLKKPKAEPNPITQIKYDTQHSKTSAPVPDTITGSVPQTISTDPEVVPVGMFQGPATLRTSYPLTSQDERILPDDDDDENDIIIGHSDSPPLIRPTHDFIKPHSQPLLVNSVSSKSNSEKVPASQPKVVQFVQKQHIVNPIPLPPPPLISTQPNSTVSKEKYSQPLTTQGSQFVKSNNASLADSAKPVPIAMKILNSDFQDEPARQITNVITTSVVSSSNETICLDSDDEDFVPIVKPAKAPTQKALKSTTKLPNLKSNPLVSNTSPSGGQVAMPVMTQSRLNAILESKKKIILVPAAEFANLDPSKKMHPQTFVQRVSSQNISAGLTDSSLAAPIVTTEQLLPENISSSVLQQANTKCLPGDIIRINKSGKIEILRKTEKPPNMTIPVASTSKSAAKPITEEFITDDKVGEQFATNQIFGSYKKKQEILDSRTKTVVDKMQKTKDNVKDSTDRGRKSSSVSNDSRSESPDPLLVLKNVVHIPADKYQSKIANEQNVTNKIPFIPKDVVVKNVKKGSNKIEVVTHQNAIRISKETPEKQIVVVRSSNESTVKRANAVLKTFESPKTHKKDSKVIDLTECFAVKSEATKAHKVTVKNIKMSGTSKEIMISKVGTLISNAKNKPSTSSVDLTAFTTPGSTKNPGPSSHKPPANNDRGKRTSPWTDVKPYKKKKLEGSKTQMTLEDFDIDDLDDIIELE